MSKNSPSLSLVEVNKDNTKPLGQVKTGEIFNNMNVFHPEGLFSVEIFGAVGTEQRNTTFGKIHLNTPILHPLIYEAVISLKSFYLKILEGKETGVWNPKTKEIEKSNDPKSRTGYSFLLEHLPKMEFQKTKSDKRRHLIKLVKKALKEETAFVDTWLVMPAGLRDYTVDRSGKPQEDEINTFYRKLLSQTNLIDPMQSRRNPEIYDGMAIGIQKTLKEIYDYIRSLLDGKHKLILSKWLSRKTFNSSRNVISSIVESVTTYDDKRRLFYNEILVGLHQYVRSAVPVSVYEIRNKYIKDIFQEGQPVAYLTNAKTLKREEVTNTHIQKEYDLWTSSDGLMKVISSLGNQDIRDEPITLNRGKHYLGLVYRDKKQFKFFQDIDDLPKELDRKHVKPVTLFEFIYMSIYHMDGRYPGLATRYPITGYGSIYPANIRVTTTRETDSLEELDYEWKGTGNIALNFPVKGSDWFNTMVVHSAHLGTLGGD